MWIMPLTLAWFSFPFLPHSPAAHLPFPAAHCCCRVSQSAVRATPSHTGGDAPHAGSEEIFVLETSHSVAGIARIRGLTLGQA